MEEERADRVFLPLFDGTNFAAWKFRMLILLEEHELVECVQTFAADVPALQEAANDSEAVKKTKELAREKRKKMDRKCKSLLVSRIHDSQLEYIQDKPAPKDIWDALRRVFERRSIASRMHLKRQMLTMRFESGTLQQHFLRFDKLVREYRATDAVLEEIDVICHLLLTLGNSYATVVTAIETMPEENLSLEFVKCRLLDEETKRKGVELCSPAASVDAAFSGSKKQPKGKKMKCFGCKQEGHKLSDCPVKKKDGNRSEKSKAHLAEQDGVCFVGFSRGSNVQCGSRKVKWFIDSGCSDHLVNDRSLFDDLKLLDRPIEIAIAKNEQCIVAKHSGTVRVLSEVNGKQIECTVKDVLFVPDLRCNLFSVMRVDDAGMKVIYEKGKVQILRGSEVVATGSRVGRLYGLNFSVGEESANKSLLTCGRIPEGLELWHRRFGHLNARSLEKLIRDEMVIGLKMNSAINAKNMVVCESCIVGKQTRKPFAVRDGKRSSRVLELIHSDVCGPVTPVGVSGVKYFVTFTDDWSHFAVVFLITSKDEVFECFQTYEALVSAKFEHKIHRLRCDNGGEYKSKQFDQFCKSKGIQVEWTVPHTPEQNGVSERLNRSLVDKARSMLEDSKVDKRFWGQAIQTAAYLLNRSPSSAIAPDVTPFELWEGCRPDVSKLRTFGCSVYVHVPKEQRSKMDAKAWKGTFLGYANNGYRVWNPRVGKIIHARDVDFLEDKEIKSKVDTVSPSDVFSVPWCLGGDDRSIEQQAVQVSDDESNEEFDSFCDDEGRLNFDQGQVVGDQGQGSSVQEEPNCDGISGRPQRNRNAPSWHADYDMDYAAYALNATSYVENLPSSLAEARTRSDWNLWEAAIREEMDSLRKNGTWKLAKLPENRAPITNKWVFKVKRGVDGAPDRYKARLVARGFNQRYGLDYSETYSPVAKLDTLRTVLALANQEKLVVHQMDVKTAFLNGTLTEEIYMVQPEGFEQGEGLVCRLEKSIYGLKQASRAWNERFHTFVEQKLKFRRSENDQCLYTRAIGSEKLIIVLYVDDVLIAGSLKAVNTVKSLLSREFEMTDIGVIKCFLGMRIDYDLEAGVMRISQQQYHEDVLRRFEMTECKPISTPLEHRLKLPKGVDECAAGPVA